MYAAIFNLKFKMDTNKINPIGKCSLFISKHDVKMA
jgi:hypothetical protein